MKTEQEQIKEMAECLSNIDETVDMCEAWNCEGCKHKQYSYGYFCEYLRKAGRLYDLGYRKASDVIDEFVERINLIECEMFHKAHDVRNSCEYKIDHGNTDDRVWGDKRACDGKMVALQDFMTKIEKLADEMRKEVEK